MSDEATLALFDTLSAKMKQLSKDNGELRMQVAHLGQTSKRRQMGQGDDEPGEIRLFGLDNCPPTYEEVNVTKGALLMSKPTGGHALVKRILASSRYYHH
jgi:hypothetical protein